MTSLRLILFCFVIIIPVGRCVVPSVDNRLILDVERAISDIEWNRWVAAIIQVESGGNDNIVGLTNDNGCLQITPILVAEVNRLLGKESYTLGDAFSRSKSIEMFNIIQSVYNPQKDFHLALKIWNPKAPVSYHAKVQREYDKLKGFL